MKKTDIKFYDSDAVSVVANLAKRPSSFSLIGTETMSKDEFNNEEHIQYLLHEIKYEKPHFKDVIDKEDLRKVLCVKPKLNNPRIIRQNGAFLLFGIGDDKTIQADSNKLDHLSIIVNKSEKKRIIQQLSSVGIDEASLFPELDHVSRYLVNRIYS